MGGSPDETIIQIPANITDWTLDPTASLCTRESTLTIDYDGPWRITVSAVEPTSGQMAEYDTRDSSYIVAGKSLKNSMVIMTNGGTRVDLSRGGVLLDGRGNASIPITFEQRVSLQDPPSSAGHVYRINIVFNILKLNKNPALTIEKMAESDPVRAGNALNYTIKYQNCGNTTAHNVVVKENYDSNVKFVTSSPMPDIGTNNSWSLGDLIDGGSGSIQVTTEVNPSTPNGNFLKNVVGISCSENIIANSSINTTVLGLQPLLQINKISSESLIIPGDYFTYTITYKNIGKINATNVSIDDILDQNLERIDINPAPTHIDLGGSHLYWNSAALNATVLVPGGSGTIVMKMHAKDRDSIPESVTKVYNQYRIESNETQGNYMTLETPLIRSLYIRKVADKSSCSPGQLINYTIFYGNTVQVPAYKVNITDNLPNVELVSANPLPSSINGKTLLWNIGTLPASSNRAITLTVQVKERPITKFDESGSVSGDGYTYERKMLSTNLVPYGLTNFVEIKGYYDLDNDGDPESPETHSDSAAVTVQDPGTEIESLEHGSGHYEQEQLVHFNYSNKSIRLDKQIFAKHAPTILSLSRNRKINIDSLWSDRTTAKNYARNETVTENYLYMDLINKQSSFLLDPNQTVYKSTGDFYGGIAQISYAKEAPHTDPGPSYPEAEISENYHGSFKIGQSLDSYGEGVSYSKIAKGQGFVASDKRVGNKQRSFEAGSGDYQSDEVIKTGVVYKDSTMTYAPNNLTAGNFKTNYSSKWHEEMRTSNQEIGASVSERITAANSVRKETLMQDANMAILGEFNGTAEIKAVDKDLSSGSGTKGKDNISIEQTYIGNFRLDTTIAINKGPIYLRPHINVTKEVLKQDDNTALFRINLTNDGNKTLVSIHITDYLPPGLTFIDSSLRPDSIGKRINWSLPSLQIGGKIAITLRASLKDTKSKFVNSVLVSAQYKGGAVRSFAACGFVLDWLSIGLTRPAPIIKHERESIPYSRDGWAPPASFDLVANISEYPLDQEIPCVSCSSEIPENDGCSSCAEGP